MDSEIQYGAVDLDQIRQEAYGNALINQNANPPETPDNQIGDHDMLNENDIDDLNDLSIEDDPDLLEDEEVPDVSFEPIPSDYDAKLPKSVLKTVMDYKKAGKAFKGEFEPNQDPKLLLENWHYDLNSIFTLHDVTNDKHKAVAAFTLLEGRAQSEARKLTPIDKEGRLQYPTFQTYVQMLERIVKATQPGDLSLTSKCWKYNILVAGTITFKKYNRVEMHAELLTFTKLIEKRAHPVDKVTTCAMIVNTFRDIPEIYDNIKTYQDEDGVRVEYSNPTNLQRNLLQYEEIYRFAVMRATRTPQNMTSVIPQAKRTVPNLSTISGATPSGSGTTSKKPKIQQTTQKSYVSPFERFPRSALKWQLKTNEDASHFSLFIKGSNRQKSEQLKTAGKCFLCKRKGHTFASCPDKKKLFDAGEFCYFPKKA